MTYIKEVKVKQQKFALVFVSLRIDLQLKRGVGINQKKIPLENRNYQNCNTLENEIHFILECPSYQDLCAEYIKRYYWVRYQIYLLLNLCLKSESKTTINKLSVYLLKSFQNVTKYFIKLFHLYIPELIG